PPFVEGVFTYLHSARTEVFTRMFPRCGIPDAYDGWQGFEDYVRFLYKTRSIAEHTQLWWSVRPHLAFPTVEIRICDAQPDLEESRALAALCYSLAARIIRAVDEGEPLPDYPNRLIEENFWRARRPSVVDEQGTAPENEQELIEELQAELRRLKVSDLLLQTLYTISSLGYHRLSGEDQDLEQARLAIEALRALLPVLEGAVPEE